MNLQHIRYAQAVMKHGSINKAAKELYITQPYLSYCIKELEHNFGIKLFNRTTLGSVVTDEGKEFIELAAPLIRDAEYIKERYSKKIQKNRYAICSTRTAVTMKVFESFYQRIADDEHYEISFYETGIIEVIDQVYYNSADIGIVLYLAEEEKFIKNYIKDKHLDLYEIDRAGIYVTISKKHKLASVKLIHGFELEPYPCVTYSDFMDPVLNIETESNVLGIDKPTRLLYVRDRHTLLRTLSLTDAYAAAPKFFDEDHELYNLTSIPVKGKSSQIRFACVARCNAGYAEQDHKYIKYQEMLKSILKEIIVQYLKE